MRLLRCRGWATSDAPSRDVTVPDEATLIHDPAQCRLDIRIGSDLKLVASIGNVYEFYEVGVVLIHAKS